MARSLLIFIRAFSMVCLFTAAVSEPTFPTENDLFEGLYTTEVEVTNVEQQYFVYATEYYDNILKQGALKLLISGMKGSIYFDNDTYQIFEVNDTTCESWDEDESIYFFNATFYGWLTHDPFIVGPSALLWSAVKKTKPKYEKIETVRDIPCEMFSLDVQSSTENLTIYYYFAPEGWTTPYTDKKREKPLRIPIRIHVSGETDIDADDWFPINIMYDFLYFKPTIDDANSLLPPVGIGCPLRKPSDDLPDIPKIFQFSAEVVDLLNGEQHADTYVDVAKVWYDKESKLARSSYYSKKTSISQLFDFNTGIMYNMQRDGRCEVKPLMNSWFEAYDGQFVARMKDPEEIFLMDETFYDMGKRKIRGLLCDTYETVKKDVFFMSQHLEKLVITAYFTEDFINVGVNGAMESRIPAYFLLTGWGTSTNITLKVQYNIFGFTDQIWPEMYTSFQLERCYTKPESKGYFVLILNVGKLDATEMEAQDDLIIMELRSMISQYAQVPNMRIPFLKADYKPSGVYVTGMLLERPPSLLQYEFWDSGILTTYDPNYRVAPDALTLEDCATACIDEGRFPCKGFYFCGQECFMKSIDPSEANENANSTKLGQCEEYIRAERESTNVRNIYLKDALKNLEDAVLDGNITVAFRFPEGEKIVKVQDIIVGSGPYTGVDAGDKPYKLTIEFRKLNPNAETTTAVRGVENANECYKKCKESDIGCSTFSFCGRARKEEKECLLSSDLVVKGITNDKDLVAAVECDIFDLKFLDYFDPYPEQVAYIGGYKVIDDVDSTEKCAQNCRMEKGNICRGFEYCKSLKKCSLHKKHILDLAEGEKSTASKKNPCIHYAARFLADYIDMGRVLISDDSNVRYGITAEECAKICSEELGKDNCKSFNYCPQSGGGTCSLSTKLLRDDGITTTDDDKCMHYEKRDAVDDWSKADAKPSSKGYTKKGFTGLVIGMLALGLILGALGFVGYSYIRSRQSGEGLSVKFMRQET